MFESGVIVARPVYAPTFGLGQSRARDDFLVHGSLRPALRRSDSRFFVLSSMQSRAVVFRGGVRRCVTVGIFLRDSCFTVRLRTGCTEASLESSPTGSIRCPFFFGGGPTAEYVATYILEFYQAEGSVPRFLLRLRRTKKAASRRKPLFIVFVCWVYSLSGETLT